MYLRALSLAVALSACGDPAGNDRDTTTPPTQEPPVTLALRVREVVSGLAAPLFLTAPAGDARLFVVEQGGRVRVVENGQLRAEPFLDVSAKVSTGGERGLLGLAFHPRYASNGWLYVNYTDRAGDTRVERYSVSAGDRNRADPASASLVIGIAQPFANHNGGMLAFGPDGMLYVGMGDGGGGGDPQNNAQNPLSLLGKLLRLDVDRGAPYAIPPDNPYAGRSSARNEIWASGLRNPWRFSFDHAERRLYVADVGQSALEEVNAVEAAEAGVNYGWRVMEGASCYAAGTCQRAGLRLPALEYGRGDGCSITGGYVYRGRIAAIRGHYFYSDYCRGWLRSARIAPDGTVSDRREWPVGALGQVLSFGEDSAGELYVLSASGRVYRIEAES
jgi:glucose/arabinose dehydrogenase